MERSSVSRTGGIVVFLLLLHGCMGNDVAGLGDFDEGLRLLEESRHEGALLAFDRALVSRPDDPRIHYQRGVTLHGLAARHQGGLTKEGDQLLSQATAAYARAVDLGSKDARAYYRLGLINTGGGYSEETLQLMDRALELDPQYVEAHYDRARALSAVGRKAEALQAFDRTVALKPDFARAHMRRASLLSQLDRPEDALAAHDRAIELAPNDSKVHFNRGRTLASLGRHGEALKAHTRATELWSTFGAAHWGRGEALEALGRHEEALEAYERSERLDGYGRTVEPVANTNYMGSLLKARLLVRMGRFEDAVKAFDAVLGTQPDREDIKQERLAAASMRRGPVRPDASGD